MKQLIKSNQLSVCKVKSEKGQKELNQRYEVVMDNEVGAPLHVVLIDHCKLDIMVKADDGVLRKPVLTLGLNPFNRMPCFFDLGLEYPSSVKVERLKSEVRYSPPEDPKNKGAIERTFKTINSRVINSLHGATKLGISGKASYNSELLTLEELKEKLVNYLTDIYPH